MKAKSRRKLSKFKLMHYTPFSPVDARTQRDQGDNHAGDGKRKGPDGSLRPASVL